MRSGARVFVLGVLSAVACRALKPLRPSGPPDLTPVLLPDIVGFAGGPVEHGASFLRRTYVRHQEPTTVTLARLPTAAAQYDAWLRMSTTDFPQAALGLPASQGNGFYQCDPHDPSRCNLLVQLRCGLHLEIRGPGITRREDADALARGLGLPALATTCPDRLAE